MKVDVAALEQYVGYRDMKYIAPAKAGERADEMETFKKDGQTARASFSDLAKQIDSELAHFKMERVSGWMNQAQIGRPLFFCYYNHEASSRVDPTFAIRLLMIEGRLGISVEVSFIERGVIPETIIRQNRVLDVPVSDGVYYFVQREGESLRVEGTEENRQGLLEQLTAGLFRKVLVKFDIPNLGQFETDEDLVAEIMSGFRALHPYYGATQGNTDF